MSHTVFICPGLTGLRLAAIVALIGGLILSVARVPVVQAATITVTTTVDELNTDGDCSLREAVRAANLDINVDACPAGGGPDTITLPAGTYTLTLAGTHEDSALTGDLDIVNGLAIAGAGAATTIIDGNSADRVFEILDAAVTLSNLSIRHGNGASVGGGGGIRNGGTLTLANSSVVDNSAWAGLTLSAVGGGIYNTGVLAVISSTISTNNSNLGGGIYNTGTATLTNSTVRDNTVSHRSGGSGGGIFNTGTLTLESSTVSGNDGGHGGGIYNTDDWGTVTLGILTLTNSTVSGNRASGGAYGLSAEGGGIRSIGGTLTLTNSTIANNRAESGPPTDLDIGVDRGGGMAITSAVIRNTLLAGNTAPHGEAPDCAGTLVSEGYNLVQRTTGCTIQGDTTGNLVGVDPMLWILQDNGGPTLTYALLPGSPAIDAGNPAPPGSAANSCAATDQRGIPRPQDGNGDGTPRCDIGAYERRPGETVARVLVYLPLIVNQP